MNGIVSAQVRILVDGKTVNKSNIYSRSVKDYADKVISKLDQYGTDKVALAKAMLNYGAYAQMYFGINTSNLANKGLYDATNDPVLNFTGNLSNRSISTVTTKGNLTFYGSSLVCTGETALRLYFGNKAGTSIANGQYTVKATSNGKTRTCICEVTDNILIVTLKGIAASELDDTFKFTITDTKNSSNTFSFDYSPLDYMATAQNSSNESLVNLTRALYLFNQAANNIK